MWPWSDKSVCGQIPELTYSLPEPCEDTVKRQSPSIKDAPELWDISVVAAAQAMVFRMATRLTFWFYYTDYGNLSLCLGQTQKWDNGSVRPGLMLFKTHLWESPKLREKASKHGEGSIAWEVRYVWNNLAYKLFDSDEVERAQRAFKQSLCHFSLNE